MLLCIKFCHLHWICWPVHRHPSRPCKQYGTCYIEVCAVRKRFWSQLWGHHTREKRDRSDLLFETYWLWFSSWNLLTSIHSSNLADFDSLFESCWLHVSIFTVVWDVQQYWQPGVEAIYTRSAGFHRSQQIQHAHRPATLHSTLPSPSTVPGAGPTSGDARQMIPLQIPVIVKMKISNSSLH